MMKKICLILMAVFAAVMFAGCWSAPVAETEPVCRVVTEIAITRESDNITKHYTSDEHLGQFLNYLRLVSPKGPAVDSLEDPNSVESFQIRVIYSDGTEQFYQQKGLRYFYDADQQWKEIDPNVAAKLPELFRTLNA